MQKTNGNRYIQRLLSKHNEPNEDWGYKPQHLENYETEKFQKDTEEEVTDSLEQELGKGSRIDSDVRMTLEHGLGTQLTNVIIHTDSKADSLARFLTLRRLLQDRIFFSEMMYTHHQRKKVSAYWHMRQHM